MGSVYRASGLWLAFVLAAGVGCDVANPIVVSDDSGGSSSNDVDDDREVLFSTLDDDGDGDGILDADDLCPDTPEFESPDEFGCACSQRDTDNDGVDDCLDECPNNARKVQAGASIECKVLFDDPTFEFAQYHPAVELNLAAACDAWSRHLSAVRDVTIEVEVRFSDISTAVASSKTVARLSSDDGMDTYEQGALAEVRTGIDPNGDEPDAVVTIGQRNLTDGLWWFDPDPQLREAELPIDKIDAYSAFLHEMGHVFVYNGWRDFENGDLPGNYLSTYDEFIVFDGENFFFTGERSVDAYGGPVPLTFGNIAHLANSAPRPGSDLLEELMNGVVTRRGKRRGISKIDLAVLADVGAPMRSQETSNLGCDDLPTAKRRWPELIVGPAPDLQERPLPPQHLADGQPCGCGH